MADALVVLNAGSSSIKFSLYAIEAPTLALDVRGQIEGLPEKPQFIARDAAGVIIGQRAWAANALDHVGGTAFLLHFIEHDLARHRVVAVGHRVVHGGVRFERPVRIQSAQLDPQRDWLLDLNKLDDGHTREASATAGRRWTLELKAWTELALAMLEAL